MALLLRAGSAAENVISSIWNELVFVLVYEAFPYDRQSGIQTRFIHALIVTLILSIAKEVCFQASSFSLFDRKETK